MVAVTRRQSRASRALAGLVLVSLALGACSSSSTPAPTAAPASAGASAAASKAPTAAPTIASAKFAGAGPVLTLDVTKSGDLVSVDMIILTQGSLVRHDASGNPKLEMAESITTSTDGLTVTVKLKPNLKYSDGTPVTSDDIKAIAEKQLNGGANSVFIASIKSVDVVDPLTAKLNLKYPDPDLLNGLSARAMALNPASKMGSADYYLKPVSAGPYMVKEFTPNKSFTMVENPNFVGGPMVVKQIEVVNVPDATSKVLQLNNKQIDFVWDIPIAAKDSLTKELRQFVIRVGGANTLFLNMLPTGKAGNKFADAKVRQAISLAIDRQAVADTAFLGLVKPLTSFWYDCPDICPTGMLPNGGKQDVAAAQKLMNDAGVKEIKAEMLVSSTRGGWKEGATIVAQQLEKIGIKFTVNPVDEATWNGAVAADNFEAVFNGGASSPQVTIASWFGTGFSATHSGYNKTNPGQAALQALIDKMAQELDVAKRKDLMTQIQTIGRDTMPYVPIVERIALDGIWLPEPVLSVADLTPGYIIMQTVAEQTAGKAAGK